MLVASQVKKHQTKTNDVDEKEDDDALSLLFVSNTSLLLNRIDVHDTFVAATATATVTHN